MGDSVGGSQWSRCHQAAKYLTLVAVQQHGLQVLYVRVTVTATVVVVVAKHLCLNNRHTKQDRDELGEVRAPSAPASSPQHEAATR